MKKDLLVDVPTRSSIDRLSQIRTTKDLSSVLLYAEAFTDFEQQIILDNKADLLPDRLPNHWFKHDYPDENSANYINSVFREKLPTLSDLKKVCITNGSVLTIVGGGTCLLGSKSASHIDSGRVVCRLNHPYMFDHAEDVGTKTTIHMFNERRLYDYTRQITRDDFYLMGVLNIAVGTVSKTACYLEYARFLDSGGGNTTLLVLKPSFLSSIASLHPNKKPTLGFVATAFGLRVYGGVTLYGFDLGSSRRHYHGTDVIHHSHDVEFEASEFINCENNLHNFKIYS